MTTATAIMKSQLHHSTSVHLCFCKDMPPKNYRRSRAVEASKTSVTAGGASESLQEGSEEQSSQLAILSWNVAGWLPTFSLIREHYKSLAEYLSKFKSCGIFCIQEAKINPSELAMPRSLGSSDGPWQSYWAFNRKKSGRNYNGVATWVKSGWPQVLSATQDVFGDPDLDDEGRCLLTDHGRFCIFNVYAPNAKWSTGSDDAAGEANKESVERKLRFLKALQRRMEECRRQGRRVILVGDLNLTYRTEDCKRSSVQYYISEGGRLSDRHGAASCEYQVLQQHSGSWKSEKEMKEFGLTAEQLDGYGMPFHSRHDASCVQWLQTLLGGEEPHWIDSFAACHQCAKERFTYWAQMANCRYHNTGTRLDYMITDCETFKDSVVQTPTQSLPGGLEGELDPSTAEAALAAATCSGNWHAAPTRGNAAGSGLTLQRDDMRLNNSQFPSQPITGILYTPPSYSDHVPVSLLLAGDLVIPSGCAATSALVSVAETKRCQPWLAQRSVLSFFTAAPKVKQPEGASVEDVATPARNEPAEPAAAKRRRHQKSSEA
eukprot:TRINITY_DN62586_c0_g1_i1.p1 TRINITY_DN62586_c0_g1~~TRINITY_DN62586_c0_g1_i1.p1  ORF type:complete len:546 (-),score=90.64 TRINITY_DN62586_c0_g1_i1:24-1661(-)